VDLRDRSLYRQLRVAAAENDMTVREIVIEAVRYWLGHQEEIEDELAAAAIERNKADPGGPQLPHDEVKRISTQHAVPANAPFPKQPS
jgi:hypothetical protein